MALMTILSTKIYFDVCFLLVRPQTGSRVMHKKHFDRAEPIFVHSVIMTKLQTLISHLFK